MKSILEIKNISKDYNDASGYNVHLLEDVSFSLSEGTVTSILAPTGSGKSALLKILAGLETPTNGTVEINSSKRKIVYIPSKPSSFPWFSVKENLSLVVKDENKIKEIIEAVGLEGYDNHFPDNKSFGFRLRISLGRAIAVDPDIIILDEPFSKEMKPVTLERMYELILSLRAKYGITFLIGTSNLSESILLSDKIYLMKKNPGKIIESIDIKFDEVRTTELLLTSKFIDYRNKIESILKKDKSQSLSNITV
jgi:ABC-type nitrate/sulfonate/bicarbonate transport system ATPase subunit